MSNFSIICCDPPYSFSDSLSMSESKRGASSNYSTLSIENIKKIDINSIANPNGCLLALWVPSSLLKEGLEIMEKWGFKQKQTYIWVKSKKNKFPNLLISIKKILKEKDILKNISNELSNIDLHDCLAFFMGRLFRQTHEICLIGINNNNIYKELKNKSQRSVSFGENLKHSAKPENLQKSLELMFPGNNINKIEIFARRQRKNWICLGNESPMTLSEDINVSIEKIKNISEQNLNIIFNLIENNDFKSLNQFWQSI